jgi:hypothetical protein
VNFVAVLDIVAREDVVGLGGLGKTLTVLSAA